MTSGAPDRPVALVTGGARRVGRAICQALARAGCHVHLTHLTSRAEALALVGELRDLGSDAHAHHLDQGDLSNVEAFARRLARDLQRLDVLIHNASVYDPTPLDNLSIDVCERTLRVNALAPLLLSSALAPRLASSPLPGGGAIVAMCDIHAMGIPRARFGAYSMSKAALAEMVRTLALELAPRVRVNGVAPGVVAWPESGQDSDPEAQARYLRRVPLARAGTPDDAAEAVRWLALDAHYTTGQIIRIDGGRSLR